MIYVDTSVLVPLFVNEPLSSAVGDWYARETETLVATAWCVTEFASALGIKQRTGALDAHLAQGAWNRFERLVVATSEQRMASCDRLPGERSRYDTRFPDVGVVIEMCFQNYRTSLESWDYIEGGSEPMQTLHREVNSKIRDAHFLLCNER